jgi:chromosome segregation ATPase
MLQISSGLTAAKERKEDLLAQLDAENEKISTFKSEVEEAEAAINEVRSQFSAELGRVEEKGGNLEEKQETLKNNLDKIDSINADNGLTLLLAAMACVQKDEFECSDPSPE